MIQSFTEKLYSRFDAEYENLANNLLKSARTDDGNAHAIAYKMDGITRAVEIIKDTYKLFITEEKEQEEDAKSLY